MIYDPEVSTLIHCPACGSTDWECWDERHFWCLDDDGDYCGDRVVGYLRCRSCKMLYTDVSVEGSDEHCHCEDE